MISNDELENLIRAAAAFFHSAVREHKLHHPEDSHAFTALALYSDARPGLRLDLFPNVALELGYSYKGDWQPFFSWQPPAPQPKELN